MIFSFQVILLSGGELMKWNISYIYVVRPIAWETSKLKPYFIIDTLLERPRKSVLSPKKGSNCLPKNTGRYESKQKYSSPHHLSRIFLALKKTFPNTISKCASSRVRTNRQNQRIKSPVIISVFRSAKDFFRLSILSLTNESFIPFL